MIEEIEKNEKNESIFKPICQYFYVFKSNVISNNMKLIVCGKAKLTSLHPYQ
jgi:hypothetical protein